MSGDGPITERGDPRDLIANQRTWPPVTARHAKATEGRTEAAAVDQAIVREKTVERALELADELTRCWSLLPTDGHRHPWRDMDDADADAKLLVAALRVLADAVERRDAEINRLRSEMNQ